MMEHWVDVELRQGEAVVFGAITVIALLCTYGRRWLRGR